MVYAKEKTLPLRNFSFLCVIAFLLFNCSGNNEPQIIVDFDECAHCKMIIGKKNESCGYFVGNEFITFDSPGCLLKEYELIKKNKKTLPERIYFIDYNSSKFIPADSTHFLMTNHIQTVMNAGVLCFNSRETVETYIKHTDEELTDWIGYQVKQGNPDNIVKIFVSPSGMKPEVVELKKNEIVEWQFCGEGLEKNVKIQLKGYERFGEVEIFSTGNVTKRRMLAKFPGSGFPFVRSSDQTPIGMVKVLGAQTSDEEVM